MELAPKEIGVSAIFGASVGVATKRLAKDALYGAGLAFMFLQSLAYFGYITINWQRVENDISKAIDQDGDGKVTVKDGKRLLERFLGVMKTGLPNAAGFGTGFYFAVKYI
jgi:uncharacterized membrane protein (Fun14 family)